MSGDGGASAIAARSPARRRARPLSGPTSARRSGGGRMVMVTLVRSLHVWSSLTFSAVARTGEVDLGVRDVLLVLRDAVAGGALDRGLRRRRARGRSVCSPKPVATVDGPSFVTLVGHPWASGKLPGQRRGSPSRRRCGRARLCQALLVLSRCRRPPARRRTWQERERHESVSALVHRVCRTLGRVADNGSSLHGEEVMSRKRLKDTSSSTTPSWFLVERALVAVCSLRRHLLEGGGDLRGVGRSGLQDGGCDEVHEVVGVHRGLRRLDHLGGGRRHADQVGAVRGLDLLLEGLERRRSRSRLSSRPPANGSPSTQAGWSASCWRTNGSAPVGGV